MHAMQITSYDGPHGVVASEAPEPAPGIGQLAVDMELAGANYVEALFAEGLMPDRPLPWVPGLEGVGRVRSLGEGVEAPGVGTEVAVLTMAGGTGSYGAVAVVDARLASAIPTGLDPVVAAAVPTNTTTAIVALERIARLEGGEHVLVHAAAGGLGSQVGQVARHLGAGRVVGVVGDEGKREAALALGYDEVWLRPDLGEQRPDRFDVVVDPVGGPGRIASVALLRLGGRLLAVGDAARADDPLVSTTGLWLSGTGVVGFNLGAFAGRHPEVVGEALRRGLSLVAEGIVRVQIVDDVPLSTAPAVLAALRSGRTVGKTVLRHGR